MENVEAMYEAGKTFGILFEVIYKGMSRIKEVGADGGYAFGSGNIIADYIPIKNYLIMLDQSWKIRGFAKEGNL